MTTDTDALLDLERRRIAAINGADGDGLRELLTDDYVHVHATGRVDDRDAYIDLVVERPRVSERGEITIHQYDDSAVMIGDQINTVNSDKTVIVVSQVAVRRGADWRFAMVHVVRKADA
jgi:hypothetical protein